MSNVFTKGDRVFLNHPGFHEDASISWRLVVNDRGYFDGSVSFRDCSESIFLELNVHSDEWYENSVDKIDTMIAHLREVKKQLPRARKAMEKAKEEYDKKKKTKKSSTNHNRTA